MRLLGLLAVWLVGAAICVGEEPPGPPKPGLEDDLKTLEGAWVRVNKGADGKTETTLRLTFSKERLGLMVQRNSLVPGELLTRSAGGGANLAMKEGEKQRMIVLTREKKVSEVKYKIAGDKLTLEGKSHAILVFGQVDLTGEWQREKKAGKP